MTAMRPEPAGGTPPAGVRTVGTRPDEATRLVLVRHGQAACNVAGVIGGRHGCTGLSPVGVRESQALRDRLMTTGELDGVTAVYASTLARAHDTAAIVVPGLGDLAVEVDCDLCELHPGQADGLTWAEFAGRYGAPDWDTDPDVVLAPGGESWTGFVARVASALTGVARRHRGELVVVFCHAGVIEASMLAFLAGASDRRRLKLRTAHTSLTEWELAVDGWRLLRYNDAAHLASLGA